MRKIAKKGATVEGERTKNAPHTSSGFNFRPIAHRFILFTSKERKINWKKYIAHIVDLYVTDYLSIQNIPK
jgi:hypothetical protein